MEKRFLFILVLVICGEIFAGALGVIHDRKDGAFVFETDAKKSSVLSCRRFAFC